MKGNPEIEAHTDSGAGVITMTDGDGGNRLAPALLEGLADALRSHVVNPEVRFVLLRSRGASFCLGMDLNAFSQMGASRDGTDGSSGSPAGFEVAVRSYADLLALIHGCPKTTVAVVEGPVRAGGVGLTAACDVVVAAEETDFELSELYLGLLPANVMPYLLSVRISPKKAAYLVQTAARLTAAEARDIGLVEEVHPRDAMEKALRGLGRRLMRISPEATARYKTFAADLDSLPHRDRGERSVRELVDIAANPAVFEAVRAFEEGDTPPWFEKFKPDKPLSGAAEGRPR